MSKARQRREAEARKRFAKKLGGLKENTVSMLLKEGGFGLISDPSLVWKVATEVMPKGTTKHPDDGALNDMMDHVRWLAEALTATFRSRRNAPQMSIGDGDFPGVVIGRGYDEGWSDRAAGLGFLGWDAGVGVDQAIEHMWVRAGRAMEGDTKLRFIVWIVGLNDIDEPTLMLGASRDGALAGRVLLNGRWMPARSGLSMWQMASKCAQGAFVDGYLSYGESRASDIAMAAMRIEAPADSEEMDQLTRVTNELDVAFSMCRDDYLAMMLNSARRVHALTSEKSAAMDGWKAQEALLRSEISTMQRQASRLAEDLMGYKAREEAMREEVARARSAPTATARPVIPLAQRLAAVF